MKNNKIVRLLIIGTVVSATLLPSYQAFAEEQSSTANQVFSSSVRQQSTERSNASETESSENPVPAPDPVNHYQLFANGSPISDRTYQDAQGNQITFQYDSKEALLANLAVHYTVKVAPGYKLSEVKIINMTNRAPVLTSAAMNDVFTMPESDVSIQLETTKEEQSKPNTKPEEKPATNNKTDSGNQNNVPKEQVTSNSAQESTANVPAANNEQPLLDRQPEGVSTTDARVPSNQATPTFSNDVQTALVQEARRHLGKPYVWGAKGPNAFDCSGLAYTVYANATGHNIGGWTGDQQYAGTQIPVSEAQPGDLLFWGAPTSVTTHVAIYIGNGQYIHAPQPGDVVKIGSLQTFTPTFAVRVNIDGLPKATTSLANAFGEYSTNQPFIFNKNQTTDQFIKKIGETSREIGQKNDIYASVMIAQAILESGSGNSSLANAPNYNLFGIKGKYKNQTVTFQTLEQDTVGANFQITSEFRKYPSYKESLEDYAKLIRNGISGNTTLYKAAWKTQTNSYKDATKHLQGRYATDKHYAEKLNAIIKAYRLTTFDQTKKSAVPITDSNGKKVQTSLKTEGDLQSKLIASSMNDPRVPHTMSTVQFVNLFRGDSLITLAMTALPASGTSNHSLSTVSSIYIPLNSGLLAVIPPIK